MEELFISKVRVKLIQLFFTTEEPLLHVREIVRRTKEEINAVRRELSHLEKAGMVESEWRANRRFYYLRKDYPFYQQLLGFVTKSSGLGGALVENKNRLGKIKYALLATRFAKHMPSSSDDVDLLIVGQIVLPELQALVANEQTKHSHEINYSFMDEVEFKFRVKRRDPFILKVITQPKIMIFGDEDELLSGASI